MFVVFCQSRKSSWSPRASGLSANFLKWYVCFSERSVAFIQIIKGSCNLRMIRSFTAMSSIESNCAQKNHFCLTVLQILEDFSWFFSCQRRAQQLGLQQCIFSVRSYPWIHSRFSLLLPHMTSGSAWAGGHRIHFGQEPQHWHIPCFLTSSSQPGASWAKLGAREEENEIMIFWI